MNREVITQHLKASFEIAFMIAKQRKPHTIGEELLKPCVLKPSQIILGEDAEQKMNCDESTDIVNCAQLIVYVRYIGGDIIQGEILYSQSLTAGTKSEDIFNSISNFVEESDLDWKKLIGLCTDGAPAMIVSFGFQNIASEIMPDFGLGYKDCKLHQEQRLEPSRRLFTLLCGDLDSDLQSPSVPYRSTLAVQRQHVGSPL
ncbi:unnamed protein product [Acanthoscelides obtectus]|uniref:DUF4371 domain-containing protein n=1 Tax=Acanthoscelides obtectus TaxID=200917 RepID=A0A9P0PRC9_ACAOB|nr:unnamed protein product [Acanthoscelides obtectus]CAK1630513.1 Protein ZBED8 [Acanthoscelides obtectus]